MTIEIFDKHPEADAYRVGGAYQPHAIVGKDKRFTKAELAAEWHSTDSPDERDVILDFHRLPHFDA